MNSVSSQLFQIYFNNKNDNAHKLKMELNEIKQTMENADNLAIFAGEIASGLALQGKYALLHDFLMELGDQRIQSFKLNEQFLRALIAYNYEMGNFQEVYSLLEKGKFLQFNGLLEIWDEAHYMEKQQDLGKPINPLIKFRIRKRYHPPPSICPTGTRPTSKLADSAKETLKTWLNENLDNPYPTKEIRDYLAEKAGLTVYQVKTWFANARRRLKSISLQVNNETKLETSRKGMGFYTDLRTIKRSFIEQQTIVPQSRNDWNYNQGVPHYVTKYRPHPIGCHPNVQVTAQQCLMELAALCDQLQPYQCTTCTPSSTSYRESHPADLGRSKMTSMGSFVNLPVHTSNQEMFTNLMDQPGHQEVKAGIIGLPYTEKIGQTENCDLYQGQTNVFSQNEIPLVDYLIRQSRDVSAGVFHQVTPQIQSAVDMEAAEVLLDLSEQQTIHFL